MALSSLQVATASFADAPGTQDNVIQKPAVLVEDTTISLDIALDQTCDQSNTEDNCFVYSCPSGYCTTCIMLMSPATQISLYSVAGLKIPLADDGFARLDSDSLFRPPKV